MLHHLEIVILLFAICFIGVSNGQEIDHELLGIFEDDFKQSDHSECTVSSGNSCSFNAMTKSTLVYPGGNTRCAYDSLTDYRFHVLPGSGSSRNNVIFHFEAGGGCLSPLTCSSEIQGFTGTFRKSCNPLTKGIFDNSNEKNPYRDWTRITVLYCTADLHLGDSTTQVGNDAAHYLNGANNTLAVINWAVQNIPRPNFLLMSGESAGALGVQGWAHKIISMYKKNGLRGSQMAVVSDSYPGFLPDEQQKVVNFFDICKDHFEIPGWVERCKNGPVGVSEMASAVQEEHRDVPFAFITAKADIVQKFYYCFLKNAYTNKFKLYANLLICNTQQHHYAGVQSVIKGYGSNVISYLTNSRQHTYFARDIFYSARASLFSKTLKEWLMELTHSSGPRRVQSICTYQFRPFLNFKCDKQLTSKSFEDQV